MIRKRSHVAKVAKLADGRHNGAMPNSPASTVPGPATFDRVRAGAFVETLKHTYEAAMLTMMLDLGHRTGLLNALAKSPASSAQLATDTNLSERHVREWLSSLTCAGVTEYDTATTTFFLPPEHALWLTGNKSTNLAPIAAMLMGLAPRLDDVEAAFRSGGGVHYDKYRPHFTHAMDALGRAKYDELLVNTYLPKAPGLPELLEGGVRVGDVGCGTGHCLNLMAAAYPASTFVGYDLSTEAVALGNAEAAAMGLTNVSFAAVDVLALPIHEPFDVLFAFDAIHDQANPVGVLARIREALAPGGLFFMVDIKASSDLTKNMGQPDKVITYGISVMHCMEVSLAVGGAGLGTAWGTELATEMLGVAGFRDITVHDIERDPSNCIYVCR